MDRSVIAEISSVCTGRRITVTCRAPGASTGRCAEDCTPTASIKSTQVWDQTISFQQKEESANRRTTF